MADDSLDVRDLLRSNVSKTIKRISGKDSQDPGDDHQATGPAE